MTCPSCELNKLRCLRCLEIGAFDESADPILIHDDECKYETCKYCEDKAIIALKEMAKNKRQDKEQ